MATRAYTITEVAGGGHLVQWTGLLNGDDGAPFVGAAAADRSIQFQGTFGVGGTIVFEGSNDGSNYQSLTDPQGNAISKTAAALEAVAEVAKPYVGATLSMYPAGRVTGDGTTNLVASLFIKK